MTLADAIIEAKRRPGHDVLAVWVRDTFGPDMPCGMSAYEIFQDPQGVRYLRIGDDNSLEVSGSLSPDEARAYAKLLLQAADEAES